LLRAEEKPAVANDGRLLLCDVVRFANNKMFSDSIFKQPTRHCEEQRDEAIPLWRTEAESWIASAFALRAMADRSLRSQ
jgi:hypothetical protein